MDLGVYVVHFVVWCQAVALKSLQTIPQTPHLELQQPKRELQKFHGRSLSTAYLRTTLSWSRWSTASLTQKSADTST